MSRGFELETTPSVLGNALEGVARSRADARNQATVRRPVSWEELIASEKLISTWQTRGCVLWLALLCAPFCFVTRASEMFCGISATCPRNVLFATGRRSVFSRKCPVPLVRNLLAQNVQPLPWGDSKWMLAWGCCWGSPGRSPPSPTPLLRAGVAHQCNTTSKAKCKSRNISFLHR